MSNLNQTQAIDPNRTMLGTAPALDINRTIIGGGPSLNTTITIKPVQCPVCKTMNPPGLMFCVDCGLIFEMALDGDAFGAPAIQLPVLVEKSGREHSIRPGASTVGRSGDIQLEDSRVSRQHATLSSESGELSITDVGSTNGTKVNGEKLIPGQPQPIQNGDVVSFGGLELTLSLPGEANKTAMVQVNKTSAIAAAPSIRNVVAKLVGPEQEWDLTPGQHVFGRKAENPIQIVDPYVSGRHGEFTVIDQDIFLEDVGSTNGILLNNRKLQAGEKVKLQPDDVIRLGSLELRVVWES